MFPFVLHYGSLVIPTFFTMVMLGVLLCTFYLYFRAPKLGFSQVAVLDLGIIGAISGIVGARIYHIVIEAWLSNPLIWSPDKKAWINMWDFYREDYWRIFEFWRGGFVSYGAYIFGTLAVILYLKYRKLPVLKYGDFVALAIPIIVIFVRIGCLGAGCCYGKPTDFFIHLVFPFHMENGPPVGVPLHATQIYDLLNGVFLFVALNLFYKKRKFDGQILLLFFMGYSFIRGLIEFMRGDEDRGVYFKDALSIAGVPGLSSAQVTGLIVIAVCVVLYVILYSRHKRSLVGNPVPMTSNSAPLL